MTTTAGENRSQGFVSQAPKLGFNAPMDGLRGIALIMVLLAHGNYETFASFAGSVDIFFVISGFLITTLLMEERRATDRVNFKQFYIRRVLRLFPVLYLVLAMTLAGALIFGDSQFISDTISDVIAAGLYSYHVVHPVGDEVIHGGWPVIRPLIQVWSLSVEEHFYLIAAVMTVFVLKRHLVKTTIALFLGMWIAIGLARYTNHVGFRLMWYQRPDSLMLGVVLAYANAMIPGELGEEAKKWSTRASNVALFVLVATAGIGTGFARSISYKLYVPFSPEEGGSLSDGLYWGQFGFTITAACIAVIVFNFVRGNEDWLARVCSWKGFRALGRRSYTIYLLHVPVFVVLVQAFGGEDEANLLPVALLYLLLMPILTEVIHQKVELPALKSKARHLYSGSSGRH